MSYLCVIRTTWVGKTYIGSLIASKTNYGFIDADEFFNKIEKDLIRSGRYNLEARTIFFKRLIRKIMRIYPKKYTTLVVAQAFTQEQNRIQFQDWSNQDVQFIHVTCTRDRARKRVLERLESEEHIIDRAMFEKYWDEFEEPKIPHLVLINEKENDVQLERNIRRLLKENKTI